MNKPMVATFAFCFLSVLGLMLLLAAPVHADPVPQTVIASVRTRLQSAVDVALPAVRCRPGVTASVINVGDGSTRIVACGVLPGFDAALVASLGTTLAELGTARPRTETLETAVLFTAYLEALAASRRAPEMTFSAETVVATRH